MRRALVLAVATLGISVGVFADPTSLPELTAQQVVNSRITVIELDQTSLADTLEWLRDVTGANIFVNWAALESTGVDQSTPVTVRLRQIPVSKLLDLMLNSAAPGQLAWYIDDNVIHITSADLANQAMITRMYPVEDLLLEIPNFVGPEMELDTSGEGGSGPFGGSSGNDNGHDEKGNETERAQELIELIQMMVVPDTWQDNGGMSSIRYFSGSLIVTAPRKVHELLGGRLD